MKTLQIMRFSNGSLAHNVSGLCVVALSRNIILTTALDRAITQNPCYVPLILEMMNRNDARKIAETITNEQLQQMFENAKAKITDWTKVSIVNKGITKGVSWNILAKDFDVNANHHILAKTNMVREFGEFLPDQVKPQKSNRQFSNKPPVHQDPKF